MSLIRGAALLLVLVLALVLPAGSEAQTRGRPELFSLTTHDGHRLSNTDLAGQPYALFFGFTSCPAICPTALHELSLVLKELGRDADRLKVFFVTVDPERDTPELLSNYVGAFDPRIVALRGSADETARAAAAFKATYRRIATGPQSYTMDHTALIFLVDRHGRYFDRVDYRTPHREQVAKFRRLLTSK